MSKQVTLRGVSDRLGRALEEHARSAGTSVNAAAIRLLENALGLNDRRRRLLRYQTWSRHELDAFEAVLREQRKVDEELWR